MLQHAAYATCHMRKLSFMARGERVAVRAAGVRTRWRLTGVDLNDGIHLNGPSARGGGGILRHQLHAKINKSRERRVKKVCHKPQKHK